MTKIEEIKQRLKLYQDIFTHPVLNDIQYLLQENERLEKEIVSGVLKDHNGCLIYRDEEYTKLESKFYKAETRIKELEDKVKAIYGAGKWDNRY